MGWANKEIVKKMEILFGHKLTVEQASSANSDLLCCPLCKSTDVGTVTRLGTTYFDCYRCDARIHFTKPGLHVDEQLKRFNTRAI